MKRTNFDLCEDEYRVTDRDDDYMLKIKEAVFRLRPMERKIWLTYVESGSYAATAREFRVSAPTAATYVKNVKDKLLKMIE